MEAYLKLLLSFSLILSAFPYLSNCTDEDPLFNCPKVVIDACGVQARQPCSGRENGCGDCIQGYEEDESGRCLIPIESTNQDLPGAVEDRVAEELAENRDQKTDDNTPTDDTATNKESSQGKSKPLVVQKKEANAAVNAENPRPFTGEIVLEEWQFMLIVGGCILLAVVGVAIAFYCCYRIQTATKDAEAEYPSYGVTGPGAAMTGDRKLAQSAQMYHYQHQKQQMIAMQKREKGESAEDASDYDSEEENDEGDLTVYECPGLAPTGEMQVKNPLFSEEQYKEPTPPPADDEP